MVSADGPGFRLTVVTAQRPEKRRKVARMFCFRKDYASTRKREQTEYFQKRSAGSRTTAATTARRVGVFPAQWKTNAYSLLLFLLKLIRTKIKHVRL